MTAVDLPIKDQEYCRMKRKWLKRKTHMVAFCYFVGEKKAY